MAQDLHQKPTRVATRTQSAFKRLLRGLNPGLHPDDVFDLLRKSAIEIDDEIDGALRRAVDPVEIGLEPRSGGLGRAVDDQIGPQILAVLERPDLRGFLDEEIERIIDRHVGDDVDLDPQFVDQLRKDVAREPVAVRVLLKVHEMVFWRHFQRMRDHPGAAVWGRPQPDDLGPEQHLPIVFVMRQMMDGGSNGHAATAAR